MEGEGRGDSWAFLGTYVARKETKTGLKFDAPCIGTNWSQYSKSALICHKGKCLRVSWGKGCATKYESRNVTTSSTRPCSFLRGAALNIIIAPPPFHRQPRCRTLQLIHLTDWVDTRIYVLKKRKHSFIHSSIYSWDKINSLACKVDWVQLFLPLLSVRIMVSKSFII